MVPLLSLGLPTNATAAVMLAALTSYAAAGTLLSRGRATWCGDHRQPADRQHAAVDLDLPLATVWARLLRLPDRPVRGDLVLRLMGRTRSTGRRSTSSCCCCGVARVRDAAIRAAGSALIIGVILGPRVELQGRRALQLSGGSRRTVRGVDQATGRFVLSPIACTIYVIVVLIMAGRCSFR